MRQTETLTTREVPVADEDSIDQMLVLAERLRAGNGGDLDESAIQAVAEATGAPVEYVRLAVKLRTEKEKRSFLGTLRSQFLTLEPWTRRYVIAGVFASGCSLLNTIEHRVEVGGGGPYGVFGMLAIVLAFFGLYNVAVSRDGKTAAISGAIFGGGYYLMKSVFAYILISGMNVRPEPMFLVPMSLAGAVLGVTCHKMLSRNRDRLGLRDPVQDRQALLRQLHDLREQLHSGEQMMTFLSIDIVGSTRMKQVADPLAVEFTFNEFHHFVERLTEKHRGRIHSTAGDGVICAFESSDDAFRAAKHIQAGLIELNTFRNKIGTPIVLRCGIHSGTVVAPDAGDVTTVSYADVIDIASHLQKATSPGTIAVSEAAAWSIPGGPQSLGSERVEVSDVRGIVWSPGAVTAPSVSTTPPPLPDGVRSA